MEKVQPFWRIALLFNQSEGTVRIAMGTVSTRW